MSFLSAALSVLPTPFYYLTELMAHLSLAFDLEFPGPDAPGPGWPFLAHPFASSICPLHFLGSTEKLGTSLVSSRDFTSSHCIDPELLKWLDFALSAS